MENIQSDEETRPLAQLPRRVARAYAADNDGSISNFKRNSFWILCFVAFLIFASATPSEDVTNKKKKRAKKLRNKAEISPPEIVQQQAEINRKIDLNEKYAQLEVSSPAYGDGKKFDDMERITESSYDEEEDNLDIEIDNVMADVDEAEEEEIEINDSMLVSAVRNMEDNVRFYFGRIFGGNGDGDSSDFVDDLADSEDEETSSDVKLSDEQLDLIAKKIADRLEADVKKDFRAKADGIAEEKVEEIDQVINEDRHADMDTRKIKDDVAEAEKVVVEDLRDEIDKAAISVKDSIPDKVKKIRNEVMQEETGRNMDYIERKKRERREKMMAKAQKLYEERLQKRKEFDEAEKSKGKGKRSMPDASTDEERLVRQNGDKKKQDMHDEKEFYEDEESSE